MVKTEAPADSSVFLFDSVQDTRFQIRQILPSHAGDELERIQFDADYRAAAEKKFHHLIIKAHALSAPGANILKQTCLSLGAEAGVHRGAINCSVDREAVLITATQAQLEKLILKLRPQPFGLKLLAESITRMLQRQKKLQKSPLQVMAILNVTPDSFSDGGKLANLDAVLLAAEESLMLGADILDIGGESTRPGTLEVPVEEELARIVPAIEAIYSRFPEAKLSIDTRKAAVAKAALEAGAFMVNDVSGLCFDPEMKHIIAQAGCPVVVMHHQGTPETMQNDPQYEDLLGELSSFFYRQVAIALAAGIQPEQIILDPGFGFGKTLEHNLELMRRLPELVSIGFPLLVGTSRKAFLTAGTPDIPISKREALTAASIAVAVQSGASIVRIHDVAAQMPVLRWLAQLNLLSF